MGRGTLSFGAAVIPQLQGFLADAIGVQRAFALPALCYVYIAWYALSGSLHPDSGGK